MVVLIYRSKMSGKANLGRKDKYSGGFFIERNISLITKINSIFVECTYMYINS